MSKPFFSIIIPVYNKEQYIQKCIDSIVAQTVEDYEVIVVNDGSTDDSQKILDTIVDPRFQVITIPNGGVSNARNIGIQKAIGEYILFIDADDYVNLNHCAIIYKDIKQSNSDLVIFGLTKVFNENIQKQIIPYKCGLVNFDEFKETFLTEFDHSEGLYGYTWNKAARRSFILKHNVTFDCSIKLAEDLDFWISTYALGPSIAFSNYSGYYYMQNVPGSSIFYYYDPWPIIDIWIKIYNFLSPVRQSDIEFIQKKIWGSFQASFLECNDITLQNISKITQRICLIKKQHSFLVNYKPTNYLCLQLKHKRIFNIFVYLKIRRAYHNLRKWFKLVL